MKTCKRCFREVEGSEVDAVDVSPATEVADYVDSRFHGNDRGETDIGVEGVNDLCPQCREELGVMDLLGFGLQGRVRKIATAPACGGRLAMIRRVIMFT